MRFAAKPVNPMTGDLSAAVNDADYLRNALRKRMAEADGKDICFDFQIQVVNGAELKPEESIEDACNEWKDRPWTTVARIAIPPQDFTTPERQQFCETLFYTPWHGLVDHRPLGGINRLRKDVYDESAKKRNCPFSPDLPPEPRRGVDPRAEEQMRAAGMSTGRPRR